MLMSVAYDQVRKMAIHNELSRRTGIAVHFFDPSRPWQRDSIENANGLVRAPSSRAAAGSIAIRSTGGSEEVRADHPVGGLSGAAPQ